jgi:hypothetical protein
MSSEDWEKEWREQEKLGEKYADLLYELNKAFRQELRKLAKGRKNVVPTKYILPKNYLARLMEEPMFRRAWQHKVAWIYIKREDQREGSWHKIELYPNIGGVPVEEGEELRVEITKIPQRRRLKCKK